MKTIINKLRYILLFGFIAMAALGNSLNAATQTWSWVGDVDGTSLPTGWSLSQSGTALNDNGDGTWYIGGQVANRGITIDASVFVGYTNITVVVRGKIDTGYSGKSVSVNGDSKTLTNTIANYTWNNVDATNGIVIGVTDGYVGLESITITGESASGGDAEEATICDGTDQNEYLPIYGYWYDSKQINQMIYPESLLTDLVGTTITSMTFYSPHLYFSNGRYTVKLGTTSQSNFSSLARNTNDLSVTVASNLSATAGGTELTITFNEPFDYEGGNLLIDFEVTTTGSYGSSHTYFYGQNNHTGGGFYSRGSSTNNAGVYTSDNGIQNFLPKVTFTYEKETEPVTDGTVSPTSLGFGAVKVGSTATQTVTVRNTGNQPFTPTINATNLPQGITVSPTTSGQVAPGGTLNLTVTFTPTAETSYSGSFTVTIPVPDGDDIVVTVNVTGSGYVVSSTLTSNTVEVPVYKSEAKADGTYIFSQDDVDGDTDMSLSYGASGAVVQVLVKDDEPISSYDLRHKVGSGNWASVATATQDSSNPKSYTVGQETFTIPSDATEMWVPMAATGVDASTTYFVPVTYANGIVTTGNTYGAPQVTATTVNLEPTLSIGGSKSAGRPGGHWTQSINGTDVDYCVYTPVISISPVYPEGAVPYLVRAWLLENEDIPFFTVTRVANANDNNTHIVGGAELTYPHPLGEMELSSEMIGGPLTIGYDWTEDNAGSAGTTIQPNAFAAPSEMSQGEISIAVRVYYYKADATQSGQKALRDGSEAPADGYGYGEGNGSDEGIPTAVSSIYTDRQVVDVKYVNTIGMQSDKPFDGVNIVVTRYSDGSITTTKVLK